MPDLPTAVSPLYLFFGGKGGTGKTTCAAAAAIASAERGRRVLVVSTDPAHSLGDVLGRKLTARVSRVRLPRGSLYACELDADRALTRWLAARRPALATILKRGTLLDRRDIDPFLDLRPHGEVHRNQCQLSHLSGTGDRFLSPVFAFMPPGSHMPTLTPRSSISSLR